MVTMLKEVIQVPHLFSYSQYGFEQCIAFNNLLFITGQAGIDKDGHVIADDIETQTEIAFKNIEYALKAGGSSLDQILSMTCYIVDIQKNGSGFWTMRKKIMPTSAYTSATIGISGLAMPKLLIEVQCIAAR